VNARITRITIFLLAIAAATAACGKKGPPLAPLRLVPAAVSEPVGRRAGQEVELRFGLPTANANGPGAVDLDRVEIYAVTVAAGAVTPPNRELLTAAHVVGTIRVKPLAEEGQDTSADKRPAPGERVTFVEELTEAALKPTPGVGTRMPTPATAKTEAAAAAAKMEASPTAAAATTEAAAAAAKPEAAATAAATQPEAAAAAAKTAAAGKPPDAAVPAPAPPTSTVATRVYAVRGLSRTGRPGLPSGRITVPLIDPPEPPSSVAVRMAAENTIVVDWTPPVAEAGGSPLHFNVYRADAPATAVNSSAVTDVKLEIRGIEYGKEQCFVVRTVLAMPAMTMESGLSKPACLTPADTFPPAAPKGLRAVAEDGVVGLVWEPNSEPDLAGYLVLRGDSTGGTLQPITPQPLKEANYRDTTVKPGVRYVYAVVAVDTATPRNSSAQSATEGVTAR